jgi:hypothetical protein
MTQTYTFKVGPDYTIATFARGNDLITLDEWSGRTLAEFAAGMTGRGFSYRVDRYELNGGRKFEEHVWEK